MGRLRDEKDLVLEAALVDGLVAKLALGAAEGRERRLDPELAAAAEAQARGVLGRKTTGGSIGSRSARMTRSVATSG